MEVSNAVVDEVSVSVKRQDSCQSCKIWPRLAEAKAKAEASVDSYSLHQPLISLHAMIHFHSHGQQSPSLHQPIILLHTMIHFYSHRQQSLSLHQPRILLHTIIHLHFHGQQSLSLSTSAAIASCNDSILFSWSTITLSLHHPLISLNAMIHIYSHGQQSLSLH